MHWSYCSLAQSHRHGIAYLYFLDYRKSPTPGWQYRKPSPSWLRPSRILTVLIGRSLRRSSCRTLKRWAINSAKNFLTTKKGLSLPGLGSSKVLVPGTWYLMQNLEYLVLTCTWHFELQKYLVLTCTWRQSTWYLSKYFQVLLSN